MLCFSINLEIIAWENSFIRDYNYLKFDEICTILRLILEKINWDWTIPILAERSSGKLFNFLFLETNTCKIIPGLRQIAISL